VQPTDTVWFKSKLDPWIAAVPVVIPLGRATAGSDSGAGTDAGPGTAANPAPSATSPDGMLVAPKQPSAP
jgi:hypothetical protein